MLKTHFLLGMLGVWGAMLTQAQAQTVGIGTAVTDPSAALDVRAADPVNRPQGFLPPRLTYAQRTAISNAAAGLLVYQSNANASPAAPAGYYFYTGAAWLPLQTQGDNLGNHTASQDIALNDNDLYLRGTTASPDLNHGLSYNTALDGPRLYGFGGGTLGTPTSTALRWDAAGRVRLGDATAPGTGYILDVNGAVGLRGASTLELGAGVAGKETNAGKIGYNAFGSGALDIVGAGTAGNNRKVKIWGEGGTEFTGPLKISGGGPGAGKVLVSDASGNATWQPAADATTASNGLTESGNNIKLGGALTETTAIAAANANVQLRLETPPPTGGPFTNSLDQQQLGSSAEAVIRTGGGVSVPVAQTFTPEYTGNTTIVRVRVRAVAFSAGSYSTTTLTLEVLAGAAGTTGGTVLATTTASVGAGSGQQVNVDFAPGITLTGGQVYTLRVAGEGTFNGVAEWFWRGTSGNSYGGGASSAGGDQYFQTFTQPSAGTGLRLRGGRTDITGPAQVWGELTAQDQLTVNGEASLNNLTVDGRLRLPTYSRGFFGGSDINGTNSATYDWTHNFGYRPVLMTSMDGTGGYNSSRIVISYSHLDDNTVRFELSNVSISPSAGRLRWLVVGP